jgi:putative ATPase
MIHAHDDMMPLAAKMRPQTLDTFYGQAHLLAPNKPLYQVLKQGHLHSMILWGPTGSGKTSLAKLLAEASSAEIVYLSAVLSGVNDIRKIVHEASLRKNQAGRQTVLFVDEVHRFNKSQQDAFLPHIENGLFTFIGATTENPSFSLNNALLSRTRVYVLKALSEEVLIKILHHALATYDCNTPKATDEFLHLIAQAANGDARNALNLLEIGLAILDSDETIKQLDVTIAEQILGERIRYGDKQGDYFYDLISALHKSIRGSDPDAALYWFGRMIDAGCDPLYIARRLIRISSEDIGNADPRALRLSLDALEAYRCLGSPEGELSIAQAVIYCAIAAKSNASYLAYNTVMSTIKSQGNLDVPIHLRNAPTALMKSLGYGKTYRYPHDYPNAYIEDEIYLPETMKKIHFYHPVARGLEIKIKEKLDQLRK